MSNRQSTIEMEETITKQHKTANIYTNLTDLKFVVVFFTNKCSRLKTKIVPKRRVFRFIFYFQI